MQESTCSEPLRVREREWLPLFDMQLVLFQIFCPGATNILYLTQNMKQERAGTSPAGKG